jgi:hypothetical protein
MSPWLRKVLGERTQICYGYGEEGEYFYLQHTLGANRSGHPRFEELVAKHFDERTRTRRPLPGGVHFWGPGETQRETLKYTGTPLTKRPVAGEPQHDEEWEYQRVILLFQHGRLVDVRPKGTEHPEYLWRETYIPK